MLAFILVLIYNKDRKRDKNQNKEGADIMLQKEFKAMTGFTATPEEYAEIEQQYYDFDGDKEKFCQEWKENGLEKVVERRQQKIEMLQEMVDGLMKVNDELREKVTALEKWQPCDCGTHMDQEKYMELWKIGKRMEPDEAIKTIAGFYGFDKSKIKVIEDVETFEKNSLGMIRVANRYKRPPVYDATDWNYARFDCAGQQWEMVNGELRGYES